MDDRIVVSTGQVRRLIADQFPQLSHLDVVPIQPGGWNNRSFRLGARHVVRLPAAARYVAQVGREGMVLPQLPTSLPVAVPKVFALGQAGRGYPFGWSILHWVEGTALHPVGRITNPEMARDIGQFLACLQKSPALVDVKPGIANFHRGGALRNYDNETRKALTDQPRETRAALLRIWEQALTSEWHRPPVWVHGDIAPGNLLSFNGRLSGVIDFGLIAAGDPACDLAIAWTHMDRRCREQFAASLSLDKYCLQRAAGWALWKAAIVLAGEAAPIDQMAVSERVMELLLCDQSFLQNSS